MSEYIKQATDFLKATKTTLKIKNGYGKKALWGESGNHYIAILSNDNGIYSFDFWGSIQDKRNHKRPTQYNILVCLNTYVDTDMSIDDFASEYGYNNTNISQVIKTYNACIEQTQELKKLFTQSELDMLNEIV
jgi:predicted DNA-binding protein YlxM (UPF0122 family)